ncbi:MAG: hypothetical protein WBG46_12260 [Nonlabens sp.]
MRHFLTIISIFISSHCWSQASSSSDFEFDIEIKHPQEITNIKVFFEVANGHTVERMNGLVDLREKTIHLTGHSSYIIWIPYPELIIQFETYRHNMPYQRHHFKIRLPDARQKKMPLIVLDTEIQKATYIVNDQSNVGISWERFTCRVSECGNETVDFLPDLRERKYADLIDKNEHRSRFEIPPRPELPIFVINAPNRPYTEEMKAFTAKYQIDFDFMELAGRAEEQQKALINNRSIIQELNRRYGTIWKQDLPVRVFGMD